MELKTISVTYGRKVNLGDYNSIHSEIGLWAELDDGDDEALAAEALRDMARHQVMKELSRVDAQLAAKAQDIFAGLPASVQANMNGHDTDSDDDGYDHAAADQDHLYRYS